MATETRLSDAVVERLRISSLAYVAPGFRVKLINVQDRMRGEGHKPRLFETLRVAALQREYYLRKTSRQLDVLRSFHAYGLSADIICETRLWKATPEFWDSYKRACAAEGLTWGGNWKSPNDPPHCQWGKYPGVVPDELVAAMNAGGLAAAWELAGALRAA